MDRNGYNPSIMQKDLTRCYRCGMSCEKLDRHEIFGGSRRQKSKELGLWVMLCHSTCHLNGVHKDAEESVRLKQEAQKCAQNAFNWSECEFIGVMGKSYL